LGIRQGAAAAPEQLQVSSMDELLDLCASDDEGLLADGLLAHVPATQPTAQTTTTISSISSSSSSSSDSSDEGEDIFASAAEVSRRRAAAKKAQVAAAAEENAAARAAQAEDADRRKRERAASRRASRSRSRSVSPELTASPPRASTTAPATAGAGAAASGTARASRRKRKRSKRSRQFYGVYLLASLHPSHTRSAYIGFTVNPPRRIRQHNGEVKGGAWKTHSKRPWEMQLVLHGFPSQVVALQFEWAWQQPLKSKPMRDAMYRAGLSERGDASRKVKVLCEMLSLPPWSRYPLTLRWLKPENRAKLLRGCRPLPPNIRVTEGSVDQIECARIVFLDSRWPARPTRRYLYA
jgi:structure-specific endonuclease subunit SLX1